MSRSKSRKKKIFLSWLGVFICSITIFLIIPVGNKIQKIVSQYLGKKFFLYFSTATIFVVFIYFGYFLLSKLKTRSIKRYVVLILIGGSYFYLIPKYTESPAEAVHFLEYGLLGYFLFKALNYSIEDKSIYFTAAFMGLFIGTIDEIIQWMVPGRIWNFRDVNVNFISSGLFQLALSNVAGTGRILGKINAKSLRIFSIVFASCILLLGLCASNTPQRVAFYTNYIPFLDFLQKEEPMGEFGYKYKDPEIGIFYSRLSPKKLQRMDEINGEKYSQILNKSVKMKYKEFLKEYNPKANPFLHEIRVHIFRRNRYFNKGEQSSNGDKRHKFYFVAYKENLILQKYFAYTTKQSIYSWGIDKIKKVKMEIDEDKKYKSPVSSNLFTGISEKNMWVSIFILIIIIMLINLIFALRKPEKGNQTA